MKKSRKLDWFSNRPVLEIRPLTRPVASTAHSHDIEIVADSAGIKAIVLPRQLPREQLDLVWRLVGGAGRATGFECRPEFNRRWKVWGVLCGDEWAREQLARAPMLPPKGLKLSFAA